MIEYASEECAGRFAHLGRNIQYFTYDPQRANDVNSRNVTLRLSPALGGVYMRPDTMDEYFLSELSFHQRLQIQPHDCILDVGANVGLFTVWACQAGAYCAVTVEAFPESAAILKRNLVLARFDDRVVTVTAAATAWSYWMNPQGVPTPAPLIPFYVSHGKSRSNHSIISRRGRTSIQVPTIGLHDFLIPTFAPTVLKLDIEGGEYDVLIPEHLPPSVDRVSVEFHLNRQDWRYNQAPALARRLEELYEPIVHPRFDNLAWTTRFVGRRRR